MSSDVRPSTYFILMSQYNAAVVPLHRVVEDYFAHLTEQKFLRKALAGEIKIPIVRIERSQKAARGIHINDLAQYIDARREAATRARDRPARSGWAALRLATGSSITDGQIAQH